jgi:MFS family permease
MRGFTVVWLGQLVSMLGTGMTSFALSFYLFEKTGQATALTIAVFFWFAPSIIFSPLAGALVDRHSRKLIIILTDLSAGIVTLTWLAILLTSGDLELWQIYLGNFITGAFNAFQFPAFSAAVSTMIPKEQFGRAAGMLDFAGAASNILAPVLAGALIGSLGLTAIMAIDVATFIVAILCVLIVQMPRPSPEPVDEGATQPSLWQDSLFGFRYIRARPSLLGLQFVFTALNFIAAFGGIIAIPMILARTDNNAASLATVQSLAAFGGVAGGLLMSAWGGPRRKVTGVLMGMSVESLLGPVVLGLARNVAGWSTGSFMSQFFIPIINGSNQAIWQRKVPPTLQGRVFSIRRMIAQFSFPIAVLFAGPIADKIFEPAMMSGGALAEVFGGLFGTGPGSGMSLMIFLSGVIGVAVGLVGYSIPAIRNVEQLLADFDQTAPGELVTTDPLSPLAEPVVEA